MKQTNKIKITEIEIDTKKTKENKVIEKDIKEMKVKKKKETKIIKEEEKKVRPDVKDFNNYEKLLDNGKEVTHIIAIADVHIRKDESRDDEYKIVFERFYKEVEELVKKEPNTIIYIGGDLIENRNIFSKSSLEMVIDFLTVMSEYCDVIMILGNHDVNMNNENTGSIIVPIVKVLNSQKKKHKIYLLNEGKVFTYNNLSFALTTMFAKETTQFCVDDKNIKINIYHGTINGCTNVDGYEFKNSLSFSVKDFDKSDYYIFGDVHKQQFLNKSKTAFYCGSLIQQTFGEDLYEHGYMYISLKDRKIEFKRIKSDYGKLRIELKKDEPIKLNEDLPKKLDLSVSCNLSDKYLIKELNEKMEKMGIHVCSYSDKINLSRSDINTSVNVGERKIDLLELHSNEGVKKLIVDYVKDKYKEISEDKIKSITDKLEDILKKEDIKFNNERREVVLKKLRFNNVMIYGGDDGKDIDDDKDNDNDKVIRYNKNIKFKNVIDFEGFKGKILLSGNNFSGKSTVIDVILLALFSRPSRGDRFSAIHTVILDKDGETVIKRMKKYSTEITVKVGDYEYTINRNVLVGQKNKKDVHERNVTITKVKYGTNDKPDNVTPSSLLAINKYIDENICTFDEVLLNAIILQNRSRSFIDYDGKERKNILCSMLNLDTLEKIYNIVKSLSISSKKIIGATENEILKNYDKYSEGCNKSNLGNIVKNISTQQKNNKIEIEKNRKEIINLEKQLGIIKSKKDKMFEELIKIGNVDEIKEKKSNMERLLEKNKISIGEMNDVVSKLEEENKSNDKGKVKIEIKNMMKEIDELKTEFEINSKKIKECELDKLKKKYDKFIDNEKNIEKIYGDIEELNDELSGLHEMKVKDYKKTDEYEKINKSMSELRDEELKYNELINKHSSEIIKVEVESELENSSIKYAKEKEEKDKLECDKKELSKSKNRYEKELLKLNEYEYDVNCLYCVKNAKSVNSQKEELISKIKQVNTQMETKNKEISKLCSEELKSNYEKCQETLNAINKNNKITIEIKNINLKLEIVKSKIETCEAQIKIMENKYDNDVDNSNKVKKNIELIKEKIRTCNSEIDKLKKNNSNNESSKEKYVEINDLIIKNNELDNKIKECNNKIDVLNERVLKLDNMAKSNENKISLENKKIEDKKKENDNIITEIEKLEKEEEKYAGKSKITKDIDELERNMNKLLNDKQKCSNVIDGLLHNVGKLEAELKNVQNMINKINKCQVDYEQYEILRNVLSEDKILSDNVLPVIESDVNNILGNLGYDKIKISLDNLNKGTTAKDKGNKRTGIEIYKSSNVMIDMISGYERNLYNLIFRVVLSKISKSVSFNFMIIDEAFDSADNSNKNKVLDIIEQISNSYDWVLVISHNDDIKDTFSRVIEIEDSGTGCKYINV